jgi:hypothetical protein
MVQSFDSAVQLRFAISNDGRDRVMRRHRFPCAIGSSPGKTLAGLHAAQRVQLLAARSPNKSPEFPVTEPNGSRSLPLGRSSLPDGKACSVWGSNILFPERMPDPQR